MLGPKDLKTTIIQPFKDINDELDIHKILERHFSGIKTTFLRYKDIYQIQRKHFSGITTTFLRYKDISQIQR